MQTKEQNDFSLIFCFRSADSEGDETCELISGQSLSFIMFHFRAICCFCMIAAISYCFFVIFLLDFFPSVQFSQTVTVIQKKKKTQNDLNSFQIHK